MENAGGSQVPRCVVAAVSDYFSSHTAQLGAGYPRSSRATKVVADAHAWLEVLMNAKGGGQVAIGPSTSQLVFNLASAFADVLQPGHTIVLQEASHESVLGPWVRLARRSGCALRWWRPDPATAASPLAGLAALLDGSTRLVVVTHVSNLLGDVLDLAAVMQMVRSAAPEAQVLADGVAYAPHRAMDVAGWGVDWYVWSAYKVYGPHMAVLYGRREATTALLAGGGVGPNHYWIDPADFTYKFELGGPSHEGCAGLLALQDYLLHLLGEGEGQQPQPQQQQQEQQQQQQQQQQQEQQVAAEQPSPSPAAGAQQPPGQQQQHHNHQDHHLPAAAQQHAPQQPAPPPPLPPPPPPPPASASLLLRGVHASRQQVEAAFSLMARLEVPLQQALLRYLAAHPAVRLVGSPDPHPAVRVPTISFVHERKGSGQVAAELQAAGFAVRCGHMYARRLVEALMAEGGLLAEGAAARQGAAGGEAELGGSGFDAQRAIDEGVVRVSLLHYNTPAEIEALVAALDRVL
ncbi:Cysteine desulfurase [Tetrabaena socialis]|uniref:Cysteine desulfurase n=1 Tax=Tetrabaena socialis TaxID=47790 RepID=A0A2J8A3D4_9CHLO|nr:Cysteine desulfurase [Tetrabaena socialis]|eukprot:PNH07031.1 Cysteine desulfurase [Tetrabaena socialis]